jgi:3-oxoacyl-[acyl-carrier protein] reductase
VTASASNELQGRELQGQVAVVTGAARNIGRSIAIDLARGGAKIVVHANTSTQSGAETVDMIKGEGGEAILAGGDVTSEADMHALMQTATDAFGRIDMLVNNAALRRETKFEDLTYAEWREVMAVLLDGPFLATKAALPALKAAGGGTIINLGGMSAHTGTTDRAHVIAAKSGVVGFTRALAFDLAPFNITANCVVPGQIDTQRGKSGHGSASLFAARVPLVGRRGQPEEVASMVRMLCGPQSRYVTGQTMHVNGGAFLI